MNKYFFILGVLFLINLNAQVKPKMNRFENLIINLSPYLLNEKEYSNPVNQTKIEGLLAEVNKTILELEHDETVKQSNMKFRFKALAEGFKDIEESYKLKAIGYSYWSLKSQLHQCSSCHTEKQLDARLYNQASYLDSDLFSQAELQFMLRNYNEAVEKYIKLIAEYPNNQLSNENLNRSVKKIGYFLVRIQQNDSNSLETIKKIKGNTQLPQYLKNHLQKWTNYLEVKKYRLLPEKSDSKTIKDLKDFIKQRESIAKHFGFGDDRFLVDQETLIYLHQVLNENSNSKLTPWLYFWIAQMQNNYKESLFDKTGELFLKECIEKYPKSDVINKCKKEYKQIKKDTV